MELLSFTTRFLFIRLGKKIPDFFNTEKIKHIFLKAFGIFLFTGHVINYTWL